MKEPRSNSKPKITGREALACPPEWRKSLIAGTKAEERNLFSEAASDDDTAAQESDVDETDADSANTDR